MKAVLSIGITLLLAFLILFILFVTAGHSRERDSGRSYSVYDSHYNKRGYIREDGAIFDKNYNRKGYIKDGSIYDNHYNRKGYIREDR